MLNHTLDQLSEGQSAIIIAVSASEQIQSRLQDLGFISGTRIQCLHKSYAQDNTAFLIRGTVIALRQEDAQNIQILPDSGQNNGKVIALAGNPNVGKSTIFNALTGLKQHTGNWAGKTVTLAQGSHLHHEENYQIIDLPGSYSLNAHSAEEEVARDFICSGEIDAVVVVCDAACLERNLHLALQIKEMFSPVILCVNLMDEAERKHILLNLPQLSKELQLPVVGISAAKEQGLDDLMDCIAEECHHHAPSAGSHSFLYQEDLEAAIEKLRAPLEELLPKRISVHWAALQLLTDAPVPGLSQPLPDSLIKEARGKMTAASVRQEISTAMVHRAEAICQRCIQYQKQDYQRTDRRLDKLLTQKYTGLPIMLLLLAFVFWLTITGANYPSSLLSSLFLAGEAPLTALLQGLHAPLWLTDVLVTGVYRVVSWVISVMLPPMAIFFPLFTLLEDCGYLPRIAFNLDHCFRKAGACGKQALTVAMGFGCNAAGVIGCRIIDSPRERLIAILTNSFTPCNGRLPALIALLTMFFVGQSTSLAPILLTGLILFSFLVTLAISKLLSSTILKGMPSSFTLELPPYRKPQFRKVIVHSIFDRTIFVLARAVLVAAPAGLLIWLLGHLTIDGSSLLQLGAQLLDPVARPFGLDGVILMAFLLGWPANEIVIPIMLMIYLSTGTLVDMENTMALKEILLANGWSWITAASVLLFFLFHWPCSTTCLTIQKETGSPKWTILGFLLPTLTGLFLCFLFNTLVHLFGF